jgi:hypothetical protein
MVSKRKNEKEAELDLVMKNKSLVMINGRF